MTHAKTFQNRAIDFAWGARSPRVGGRRGGTMRLSLIVAGLLGHAAALEPMGVGDLLGGTPSAGADVAGSIGASGAVN